MRVRRTRTLLERRTSHYSLGNGYKLQNLETQQKIEILVILLTVSDSAARIDVNP